MDNIQKIEDLQKIHEEFYGDSAAWNEIFEERDAGIKEAKKTALQQKAVSLKITKGAFNKVFKSKQQEYYNKRAQSGIRKTSFSGLSQQYFCGEWIATDEGIYRIKETAYIGETMNVYACSHPVYIKETSEDMQGGNERVKLSFYRRGQWKDINTNITTINSTQNILTLAADGISVNSTNSAELVNFLSTLIDQNEDNIKHVVSTNKLGWTSNLKFLPYDNEEIIVDGASDFKHVYDSLQSKGSVEEWITETTKISDSSLEARLVIAASFVSPLLHLLSLQPFICHLWGTSGDGKTVMQMVAASVWGNPAIGKLLFSLKNTQVSFEVTSDFLNSIPMVCDELQEVKHYYKNGYDRLIMTLCGGQGKGRGTKDGGRRADTNWNLCYIFSGEEPILDDNMGGGSANRVFQIQTKGKLITDGRKTANFYKNNYGHMGKRFIKIIKSYDVNTLDKILTQYFNEMNKYTTEKQANIAAVILLADYLISKHIFNKNPLEATDLGDSFTLSKEETNTGLRAYRFIMSQIVINAVRFTSIEDGNSGEVWGKIEGEICYFERWKLEKMLKNEGFNYKAVFDYWKDNNFIRKIKEGNRMRYSKKIKINGNSGRYIPISLETDSYNDFSIEANSLKISDEFF